MQNEKYFIFKKSQIDEINVLYAMDTRYLFAEKPKVVKFVFFKNAYVYLQEKA